MLAFDNSFVRLNTLIMGDATLDRTSALHDIFLTSPITILFDDTSFFRNILLREAFIVEGSFIELGANRGGVAPRKLAWWWAGIDDVISVLETAASSGCEDISSCRFQYAK